jgi:hypothetical protein
MRGALAVTVADTGIVGLAVMRYEMVNGQEVYLPAVLAGCPVVPRTIIVPWICTAELFSARENSRLLSRKPIMACTAEETLKL